MMPAAETERGSTVARGRVSESLAKISRNSRAERSRALVRGEEMPELQLKLPNTCARSRLSMERSRPRAFGQRTG